MKPEHTLCEHIRIVNQKIEQIIRSGKRMNDMQKWFALQSTLSDKYSYRFFIFFLQLRRMCPMMNMYMHVWRTTFGTT